jgi:hypothetical protein
MHHGRTRKIHAIQEYRLAENNLRRKKERKKDTAAVESEEGLAEPQ